MNLTEHYSLQKPISEEKYDVNVANMNMDLIDSALNRIELQNQTQDNLLATKKALNSEIVRATEAENANAKNIAHETERAISAEDALRYDLTGQIQTEISNHDISDSSHADIRNLITVLATKLNALVDSDDTTLDQLSEIVAYIKNNKSLIDGITSNKINFSDIIDNLTSTDTAKPLSAKQGKVLKDLLTDLAGTIPTKTSQLTNDSGFKTTDSDTSYSAGTQLSLAGTTFKLKDNCTMITDWNMAITNGWYMSYNAANSPINGWVYGIVIAHNSICVRQIVYLFAVGDNILVAGNDRYERVNHQGNWGSWVNTSFRNKVNKTGDTMTGALSSSKSSGSYLAGNQGQAIINSTAAAGAYTMLDKLNSANGYFTDGVYQGRREFHYTAKATVDAGTNAVTKNLTLLDEAGNSNFPGKITAQCFNGNATSATKLAAARSLNGMLFDGTADRTNYGTFNKVEEASVTTSAGATLLLWVLFVDCPGFKLATGAEIKVKFKSYNEIKYMNVNNTGNVEIVGLSYFEHETYYTFVYNGGKWVLRSADNILMKYCVAGEAAVGGASEEFVPLNKYFKYLVIGRGSSVNANYDYGAEDYFKASIIQRKDFASTNVNNSFIMHELTLASAGSTARYSIVRENDTLGVTIKTPNGSFSNVCFYILY